ncbi:dUTP diphosphatase [Clostridium sp. NSJ-49]|jgi:dimeric dUTPase (all-alpha-NTP-PPase superfamily)|uniref:dUTPase superfamily n=1 Tax=Clostridium disporicum TaxID=84024 RepID=A0A174HYH7_9CLOT|nr:MULTISPECIES: dUTP diphosphatase [Clostridium]MBC5625190.1 dUTP diphosphatase [Clostridium sp. NSJ-49]MCD2502744.1 dUTP diphosphatase [Clostridium sp. NSJ-145]CUO79944.1 dUTPase superfamily [Clostridium disporicum]
MNISSIVESQLEKNKQLLINHELPEYKLWVRKHLELHVKLGSIAEETKCYTYLENVSSSLNKDIIFKKYVDFLAHIISLGLYREYISDYEVQLKPNDYCLSDQFLNLYIDINDLIVSTSSDHFLTLLEDTLSLGVTLGYSEKDIINSFIYGD